MRQVRGEHVNIASTNVLSIQRSLCTLSLFIVRQEHQSVASHLTVGFVKNNVAFCNSEVTKEVTDFFNRCVERKTSNLDQAGTVCLSDIVGETHKLGGSLTLSLRITLLVSLSLRLILLLIIISRFSHVVTLGSVTTTASLVATATSWEVRLHIKVRGKFIVITIFLIPSTIVVVVGVSYVFATATSTTTATTLATTTTSTSVATFLCSTVLSSFLE